MPGQLNVVGKLDLERTLDNRLGEVVAERIDRLPAKRQQHSEIVNVIYAMNVSQRRSGDVGAGLRVLRDAFVGGRTGARWLVVAVDPDAFAALRGRADEGERDAGCAQGDHTEAFPQWSPQGAPLFVSAMLGSLAQFEGMNGRAKTALFPRCFC